MDYEKAYKQALERAKAEAIDGYLDAVALETIFPELRESEDEQSRKKIEQLIRLNTSGAEKTQLLAYLEKQKPAWSEEDERRIDAICELLENTSAIHPNYSHRKLIIWLKSLRPSWKPSEEQMEALRKAVNKLAKTDVADSVRLSIIYDNLKKL